MTQKEALTPEFNWEATLFLAHVCQLAYREPGEVENTVKNEWGFEDVALFDVDEQQGFVCSDAMRVIIAFRGTDDFPDWVTNLDLPPTDTPYGKVHRGFQGAWSSCEYDVTSALERFDRERTKELYITGHSLGGAIASIAAMELPKTRSIQGVYTFGQPRTGAEEFAKSYESILPNIYYRIVNDQDIVAMIPPGYTHCGKLYWFDDKGQLKPETAQTPMASSEEYNRLKRKVDEVKLRLNERGILPGPQRRREEMQELREQVPNVDDHMMDNYIACCGCQVTGKPLPETKAEPEDPGAPVKSAGEGSKPLGRAKPQAPSQLSPSTPSESMSEASTGVKVNKLSGFKGALVVILLLLVIAGIVIYFFGDKLGIQLLPVEPNP